MQVKLARALGNPDKTRREKTIKMLNQYVPGNDFNDLEMLKLWKALHYCLWLTDKAAIQEDVSQMLCNLLHTCKDDEQALQFLRCFFQTVMREWGALDYHRINKFYTFIRLFITFFMARGKVEINLIISS